MSRPLPRLGAAFVLALTATLVTACASAAPEAESTETTAPVTEETTAPETEETEAPVVEAEDPTCETLILETTVKDFGSIGWTYEQQPFYLGEGELEGGLTCVWADFAAPAGDNLQMFGWAPITAAEAASAQSTLVGAGWIREDAPEGVYITENPDTTITQDAEGYGMTYLFVDGAVTYADTKQNLLLIEAPAV